MKFLKTLGVLLGLGLLTLIATIVGFEFFKPFVMPHLSGGIAADINSVARPLEALEQLIGVGAFIIVLNYISGASKWLHKGVNLLINAPLALASMGVALYGAYGHFLMQQIPNVERLGLLGALFVLSLFWILISLKVNLMGKHLFQPKDWPSRKKAVDAVVEKVEETIEEVTNQEPREEEVRV